MEMTKRSIPKPSVMTPMRRLRKARDQKMFAEYVRLFREDPKRAKTPVYNYLMEKYSLASIAGFYAAMDRAEAYEDTPAEQVRYYRSIRKS